jgi:predicted Zn-dependent protease
MLLRVTCAFSLCCASSVARPQDWTTAARQAQESGDYRKAAQAYSSLLAREPNNPQLLSNIGIMYYLAGEDRTALRSLRRALQLSPTLIPANLFTGLSLVRLHRPGEALAYLRRAHDADTRALLPLLGHRYSWREAA